MKIQERLTRLRDKYIEWYTLDARLINYESTSKIDKATEDAKYSWWEREKNCQEWCSKEGTYVPMSDSKTLRIMKEWFNDRKN